MVSETRKILEKLISGNKEEAKLAEQTDNGYYQENGRSNLAGVSTVSDNTNQAYLTFDGRKLGWNQGGQEVKSWPAMSGKVDYQSAQHQGVINKGPIPEGVWRVNQNRYQNYDSQTFWEKGLNYLPFDRVGKWKGGRYAWGNNRVWLEPSPSTNVRGRDRDSFTIHGGSVFGSAGCIDLADGMDDFTNDYLEYGQDMNLHIKYPKDF